MRDKNISKVISLPISINVQIQFICQRENSRTSLKAMSSMLKISCLLSCIKLELFCRRNHLDGALRKLKEKKATLKLRRKSLLLRRQRRRIKMLKTRDQRLHQLKIFL